MATINITADSEIWRKEDGDGSPTGGPRNRVFEQLPKEIIEQILYLSTPNAFASLIVLNRRWRNISQKASLYAHHLSQCPSYAATHRENHHFKDMRDDDLPQLRRCFAQEIKRNLFEAYLRPNETIISLVSTSIGSSSAPGGEAFHFSLPPRGSYILAYSSSRIHIIDVGQEEVIIRRELKILRRPAATTIADDGSFLAVLSADLQIDLYDLTSTDPKLTRTIPLDHMPRTIALSPDGSVIAAAYDAGVEVLSLKESYQNLGRRAVKCYAVDRLSFSRDGMQLLGSTINSRNSSTVILTAPYFDPGAAAPEDAVSALWTTSILFPNGSRDCSHAALLSGSSIDDGSWLFAYDRIFETFRAVRVNDLRNGTTYFTGPVSESSSPLIPSTLPTASASGDIVAAGFQGSVWLYGVPEDLEAPPIPSRVPGSPESGMSTPVSPLGRRNSAPSLRAVRRQRDSVVRVPQWQVLCDRLRNTFVEGRKASSLDRCSAMTWVSNKESSSHRERLVIVAPGVLPHSDLTEDDGLRPVDGGRILILDFDYSVQDGRKHSITIEVGAKEPQVLEEERRDLDTEVAIVRRRTVAQRRQDRSHINRSSTTSARSGRHDFMPLPEILDREQLSTSRPRRRPSTQTTSSVTSETNSLDDMEAFDAPYAHGAPRSQTTLRRAATAAASNRRFRPVAPEHIEYRRADGREEHPHESDADNWVPPPPPYSRDLVPDLPPLPEHIQRSILAEAALATLQRNATQRSPVLDFPGLDGSPLTRSRTVASTSSSGSRRYQFHRTFSDTTPSIHNSERLLSDGEIRPSTSTGVTPIGDSDDDDDDDDLYGVSPQHTPPQTPRRLSEPTISPRPLSQENNSADSTVNQIRRRPVGSSMPSTEVNLSPSPKPIMVASLQQPASPVPEPITTPISAETSDQIISEGESTSLLPKSTGIYTHDPAASFALTGVTSSVSQAQQKQRLSVANMNKDVPPRPDSEHHLTELPPTTPVFMGQRSDGFFPRRSETAPVASSVSPEVEEDPIPIWQRTGTAPAATSISGSNTAGIAMPTSDQLARLNSRSGRPTSAADPRRVSGSSGHRRSTSGGTPRDIFPWVIPNQETSQSRSIGDQSYNQPQSHQNATYRGTYHLPRPHSGSASQQSSHDRRGSLSTSPGRRISSSPSPNGYSNRYHNPSLASPSHSMSHSRPNMPARLDTIHSVVSTPGIGPEQSAYFAQKQAVLGRQPSRAERSAAKNIEDAKKRGWRSTMKKEEKSKSKKSKSKKSAGWDVASSAGWTDVTVESSGALGAKKEKKEGKCTVM